jgi:hypothetical protein|tara:strand:+ start:147 stop:290 length:144 start_codon:yes stop_codon:yes gene_type:complete
VDKDKELWSVGNFNANDFKDIILIEKHYSVEVETTKYDAGFGGVFRE